MISVLNYSDAIQKIDLETLPKVLRDGHEFFLEANSWYKQDETVTESFDLYIKKLKDHLHQILDVAYPNF